MASQVVTVETADGFEDSLEGALLRAGDRVYIRWPAGFTQPVEVKIECVPRGILREGKVETVECRKAYFLVSALGDQARIYLHGFTAQRLR